MLSRSTHTALSLVGLALLAAAPFARAQVTVNLTTPQLATCTVTTDAQGLRLVPGGAVLQATGVTLAGTGCGGGNSDFQAAVSVPATATTGTAFNVQWSASSAATQCTFGGTAGATGWPVGSTACQGANCGGTHVASVTIPSAGNYTLGVTCTNASGVAQGTVNAAGGPPSPNPFTLNAPASANAGIPFSVSWSVNGATACTGTASLGGSSASLPGWTDSTSAVSPRSVTAAAAGVYTLGMICSNASPGSATATPINVTVVQDASCQSPGLTRLTTATIKYPNISGQPQRVNVDLTAFENIWGHATNTDTAVLFPGENGAVPAITNWGKTQFVAAKFTAPATWVGTAFDKLAYSTYNSGPHLTMAVSTTCGDFAPANPTLCLSTDVAGGDVFKKMVVSPLTNGCPLSAGTSYYINLKMTNPAPSDCSNSTVCTLSTNNSNR